MSVGELKAALAKMRVRCDHCFEKADLLALYKTEMSRERPTPNPAAAAASGFASATSTPAPAPAPAPSSSGDGGSVSSQANLD